MSITIIFYSDILLSIKNYDFRQINIFYNIPMQYAYMQYLISK